MEYTAQDVKDIIAELSKINSRLAGIEEAQKHPSPTCAIHGEQLRTLNERVDSIETQQGKQNLIAITLGAIGAAVILAIKYLAGRS